MFARAKKSLLILCSAILLTSAFGCAHLRASAAQKQKENELIGAYVFKQPIDQVWPEAQSILFESGYSMAAESNKSYSEQTEWKFHDDSKSQYRVIGMKNDDSSCRIKFLLQRVLVKKSKTSMGGDFNGEDLEIKKRLILRLAPEDAAHIEQLAAEHAAVVRNS